MMPKFYYAYNKVNIHFIDWLSNIAWVQPHYNKIASFRLGQYVKGYFE